MKDCLLKVSGAGAIAFVALASSAKNLETYLLLPGAYWILGGTFLVCVWTYEKYCVDNSKGGST